MSLASALLAATATAGTFTVTPTTLTLGEHHHSATLVLNNTGPQAIRFEATSFRWDESEAGEMLLEPTDELLVFPTIFSIAPGESRAIRVGTMNATEPDERTWRLFIEELPSLSIQGQVGVQVRTRMGIPIFLAPTDVRPAGHIADGQMHGSRVSLRVVNDGNVHFRVAEVRVVGRAADGAAAFDASARGWYVLAGGARAFEFDIPREVCAELTSLELTAEADLATWTVAVPADATGCAQ